MMNLDVAISRGFFICLVASGTLFATDLNVTKVDLNSTKQEQQAFDELYKRIISYQRSVATSAEISAIPDIFKYKQVVNPQPQTETVATPPPVVYVPPPKVLAIVNNKVKLDEQWVKQYDSVKGWRVLEIQSDKVLLEGPSGERNFYPLNRINVLQVGNR